MKCSKCGYENRDDALYCNLCHTVLRKVGKEVKPVLKPTKEIPFRGKEMIEGEDIIIARSAIMGVRILVWILLIRGILGLLKLPFGSFPSTSVELFRNILLVLIQGVFTGAFIAHWCESIPGAGFMGGFVGAGLSFIIGSLTFGLDPLLYGGEEYWGFILIFCIIGFIRGIIVGLIVGSSVIEKVLKY